MPTPSADAGDRLAVRYERWSQMPESYRTAAARLASFQCLAELVGVLPFAEWVHRVPDFARKQMLIAKVQDEVGHGHMMARIAEDLGTSREEILTDFVEGRSKLLNIFHFRYHTWEEFAPGALLQNSAAIVQFQSLKHGTYLPYARALQRIEKEESFHYHHALDLIHELMHNGTGEQRRLLRAAVETWLPRVLGYFGPPDTGKVEGNRGYQLGLKVDANDDLRQRWLTRIVPVLRDLGLDPEPDLVRFDQDTQAWTYQPIDWEAVRRMLSDGGPAYGDWVAHVRRCLDRNRPYRQLALGAAA